MLTFVLILASALQVWRIGAILFTCGAAAMSPGTMPIAAWCWLPGTPLRQRSCPTWREGCRVPRRPYVRTARCAGSSSSGTVPGYCPLNPRRRDSGQDHIATDRQPQPDVPAGAGRGFARRARPLSAGDPGARSLPTTDRRPTRGRSAGWSMARSGTP